MVLLSALPCSDEVEDQDFTTQTISTVSHQEDDCSTESCLPTCACNCCGQSVVEVDLSVTKIAIPILELPKFTFNYQFKLAQSDQNIWQPPKLV
jgi:hypothetical protein